MVVKLDLTPAQARDLFWFTRARLRDYDVSPVARALRQLHDELEAKLADDE